MHICGHRVHVKNICGPARTCEKPKTFAGERGHVKRGKVDGRGCFASGIDKEFNALLSVRTNTNPRYKLVLQGCLKAN